MAACPGWPKRIPPSAGYARAGNRIDLRVSGGIGSITIQSAGGD
jgi:hypothetical protein